MWFKWIYFVNQGDQLHKYVAERVDPLKTVYFRELPDCFHYGRGVS